MSAFPAFAHLGRSKVAPVRAEESDEDKKKREDEDKKAKAEEDEEQAKKAKAEEDDEKKKKDDEDKKAKKAKADKDKEEDDKKAQARQDNDDGDRADLVDPVVSAARLRERGRVRAIMLSDAGKANPVAAAHLATGTSMSRSEAIEMLAAIGEQPVAPAPTPTSAKSDALRTRMQDVNIPSVGSGDVARGQVSLADQIVMAGKKRRGEWPDTSSKS